MICTHYNYLSKNYVNIPFKKKYFQSSSKIYVKNFIKFDNTTGPDNSLFAIEGWHK